MLNASMSLLVFVLYSVCLFCAHGTKWSFEMEGTQYCMKGGSNIFEVVIHKGDDPKLRQVTFDYVHGECELIVPFIGKSGTTSGLWRLPSERYDNPKQIENTLVFQQGVLLNKTTRPILGAIVSCNQSKEVLRKLERKSGNLGDVPFNRGTLQLKDANDRPVRLSITEIEVKDSIGVKVELVNGMYYVSPMSPSTNSMVVATAQKNDVIDYPLTSNSAGNYIRKSDRDLPSSTTGGVSKCLKKNQLGSSKLSVLEGLDSPDSSKSGKMSERGSTHSLFNQQSPSQRKSILSSSGSLNSPAFPTDRKTSVTGLSQKPASEKSPNSRKKLHIGSSDSVHSPPSPNPAYAQYSLRSYLDFLRPPSIADFDLFLDEDTNENVYGAHW